MPDQPTPPEPQAAPPPELMRLHLHLLIDRLPNTALTALWHLMSLWLTPPRTPPEGP